jgi:hypothetical protein
MAQEMDQRIDFFSRLAAAERSNEIPESADVYGWLCGSWDLEVLHYRGVDVAARGLKGKFTRHACSRGAPSRTCGSCRKPAIDLPSNADRAMNMYGTTLRSWDPSVQAWRIAWTNPVRGHVMTELDAFDEDGVARHVTVRQRQGSGGTSLRRFCGINSTAQPNSSASKRALALRTRGAQL